MSITLSAWWSQFAHQMQLRSAVTSVSISCKLRMPHSVRNKNYPCDLTHQPAYTHSFKLEVVLNALMQTQNERVNVKEGILIFRQSVNTVRPIAWWCSLGRRIAWSTSTAKPLAAPDAVDREMFLKHLFEKSAGPQTTELVLYSRPVVCPCSTAKEPEETESELLLASIREKFFFSVCLIWWVLGQSHLAAALTKDRQVIAKTVNNVF